MQLVINPQEFSVMSNITITKPKLDKKTKRLISAILYNNNPAYFETPEIRAPFGLSKYEKGNTGTYDYSLPLKATALSNENQELVDKFFAELTEMDNNMLEYGVKYSKEIFGKVYNESQKGIVEALYSRGVKVSQDGDGNDYPAKISPKISKAYESDKPELLVFRTSTKPIVFESWESLGEVLTPGIPVRAIIQPRAWFIGGKFGITYRILQLKLPDEKKVGRPLTYAFSVSPKNADDSGETSEHIDNQDDDNHDSDNRMDETQEEKPNSNTEYVNDSDEEEEEEEEED